MGNLRIVIVGFGNIGQAVAQQIADRHPAAEGIVITGVCDARMGGVVDRGGLDAQTLIDTARDDRSLTGLPGALSHVDVFDTIDASGADALVEATFTDLTTGEPATAHIRHAISRGMSVSTTNKGPIALHLEELELQAAEAGVTLAYEGTVMSGTPAVLTAVRSIASAGFIGASGVLNGTTNYIITRMEEGVSYEEALTEAQGLGYAETDPSGDVDGHDAAGKLSILARVLAGTTILPRDVKQVSLSMLVADSVTRSLAQGRKWRYLAVLEQSGDGWKASVGPVEIDDSHPLASVSGATNAVTFQTELLGDVTLMGPGAGRRETAYAVLNDLSRIASSVAR